MGRARGLFLEGAPALAAVEPRVRPGMRMARGVYVRVLDRVESLGYDVLGRRAGLPPWQLGRGRPRRAAGARVTRRATLRGAERTEIADREADVLICGASFAGLAVARELAGCGADVLVVDRYEIGERQTSACAAPTPWLHAMGVEGSIRQEIPHMSFHTPHGRSRYRLPWSWSAFDYRTLCELLWEQCDARFEIAKVERRDAARRRDRPRCARGAADRRRAGLAPRAGRSAATSRPNLPSRAAWRCIPTAEAPTWTCGSTAPWCAAATAGASRPRASSGWAPAPMSRATT